MGETGIGTAVEFEIVVELFGLVEFGSGDTAVLGRWCGIGVGMRCWG